MEKFKLISDYQMQGDQPEAVAQLGRGIQENLRQQTLLGVTGSGKTFTMANIIEKIQKPTLVIAHNKTLAAQLCSEFKQFFPENAVEYFVSYYDYYQPEAYIPHTDTYIEKDAAINDEIDRLRHSATSALLERKDVIIVSSVSCIYGLGSPEDYLGMIVALKKGETIKRETILRRLVDIQYARNDISLQRGTFRVRGDVIEIIPVYGEKIIRLELFGDEVDRICEVDPVTGKVIKEKNKVTVFPAKHFVTSGEKMEKALIAIEEELEERLDYLKERDKLLEAQRLEQRTRYDLEMLREMGYCQGVENYSRHLTGRQLGEPPFTLLDYFPQDFLMFIDESHVTIPQIRGMYGGDRARKNNLVEHGFRLPSAYDNRPLVFEEFVAKIPQVIYVSATPAPYEIAQSEKVVEQIIRPTGLLDPEIEVFPVQGQIDHLIGQVQERVERGERILVTTLTKRMAEDLTDYLKEIDIKVRYLHSDIDTLERTEILRDLRLGVFDVLVGINLLREGLDLPEVSLVAILDADKEGFLRSETSLIQTIGRAARHLHGKVIMYADKITDSMQKALSETKRRRELQHEYNQKHGIIPQAIKKDVAKLLVEEEAVVPKERKPLEQMTKKQIAVWEKKLEKEMKEAAKALDFERAAVLRDQLMEVKKWQRIK